MKKILKILTIICAFNVLTGAQASEEISTREKIFGSISLVGMGITAITFFPMVTAAIKIPKKYFEYKNASTEQFKQELLENVNTVNTEGNVLLKNETSSRIETIDDLHLVNSMIETINKNDHTDKEYTYPKFKEASEQFTQMHQAYTEAHSEQGKEIIESGNKWKNIEQKSAWTGLISSSFTLISLTLLKFFRYNNA